MEKKLALRKEVVENLSSGSNNQAQGYENRGMPNNQGKTPENIGLPPTWASGWC